MICKGNFGFTYIRIEHQIILVSLINELALIEHLQKKNDNEKNDKKDVKSSNSLNIIINKKDDFENSLEYKTNENLYNDDSGNNTENQNTNNIVIPNEVNLSMIAYLIKRN